jgi:ABC-2 type transport system permease protein
VRFLIKLLSFFRHDFAIQSSYRSAFVLELAETLFAAASFYYLSKFIDGPAIHAALPAGQTYFAFALVGVAFFDYMNVALNAFDQALEEARRTGTLEALLVTDTSLPVILAGSAIYPFVYESVRTGIYLVWGILLFKFPVSQANWPGALVVLLASILAFAGLGILSASYLLLFMRGNPAKWLLLGASGSRGDDVSCLGPPACTPSTLAAIARYLFPGRLARRAAGRCQFCRFVAIHPSPGGFRYRAAARLLRSFFVGPPPHQN